MWKCLPSSSAGKFGGVGGQTKKKKKKKKKGTEEFQGKEEVILRTPEDEPLGK